jgi:hypothetical protein
MARLTILESRLLRRPLRKKFITRTKALAVVINGISELSSDVVWITPLDFCLGSSCERTRDYLTCIPEVLVKHLECLKPIEILS